MRRFPALLPIIPLLAVFLMPGMPATLAEADSNSPQTNSPQTNSPQTNSVDSQNGTATAAPLLGKWIVRSVQHDANPTAAQIGRKVGDIIKFTRGADGNIGLT